MSSPFYTYGFRKLSLLVKLVRSNIIRYAFCPDNNDVDGFFIIRMFDFKLFKHSAHFWIQRNRQRHMGFGVFFYLFRHINLALDEL